jgi:hypothetical protein
MGYKILGFISGVSLGPNQPAIHFFTDALPVEVKGKAIPLQALTGPEGSRRLRIPDFKTFGT